MGTSSPNIPSEISPIQDLDWKQEVNERVAAHRTRRGLAEAAQASLPLEAEDKPVKSRARVAARVAARYANAPLYSEVLALQEKAAATESGTSEADAAGSQAAGPDVASGWARSLLPANNVEATTVQKVNHDGKDAGASEYRATETEATKIADSETGIVTPDQVSADQVGAVEWIPGNVIEFPRVLVAPRKARPRLAEGPLREDATVDSDPEHSQLRIFEVEQQAISTTAQVAPVATEWSSIRLDAFPPASAEIDGEATPVVAQLQTAPVSDRLMAALVDGALVALAFLGFVAVFVACTAHPPTGKPALVAAGITLAVFFVLYQFLFFSFSESTPGMRYAHIALCTFTDDNPTREQLRRRIGALLLSASPLALGLAWALFDEDNLGWHDRMTRTYQRSYR